MESKPRGWCHLLLLLVLLVSLHRSCHAQPATSSTWPGPTIKDAFNRTHFGAILIAFLSSIVFFIFLSLFIRHCFDTYATTGMTHTSSSSCASADRCRLEAIDRCPVLVYSDVKELRIGNCSALECAVCLIEFEDTDKIRLLPKCSHVFHPDCIDRWFSSRLTCPVCRAKFTPSDCADADALTESNHDESSVEDSETEQLSTVGSTERPLVETIDADDEIGSGTGNIPTGTEPRIRRSRTAAERFARSHSTGHCLFMESEEVIERYTLRLPEHVREEIFGRHQKRRLRRCASSNDVVLSGEWNSKKGGDHNMERWVLPCMTTPPPFSKDLSSVKLLMQNFNNQIDSSSHRPPI